MAGVNLYSPVVPTLIGQALFTVILVVMFAIQLELSWGQLSRTGSVRPHALKLTNNAMAIPKYMQRLHIHRLNFLTELTLDLSPARRQSASGLI